MVTNPISPTLNLANGYNKVFNINVQRYGQLIISSKNPLNMSIKTSGLQILWRIRVKLSRLPVFPVGWLEQTLMIQTKKKTLWVFIAVFYFHIPVQSSLKSSTKGENSYVSCKSCLIDHSEKKIKFCKNICLKNVEFKLLIKTIKFENVLCQINGNWSFLIRIKIKTHLICNHFIQNYAHMIVYLISWDSVQNTLI